MQPNIVAKGAQYIIVKSDKRKTLGIQIKPGQVIVRAPKYLTDKEISHLVAKKSNWIDKKLNVLSTASVQTKKYFSQGSLVSLFGNDYPLDINFAKSSSIAFTNNKVVINLPTNQRSRYQDPQICHQKIINLLIQLYTKELQSYLNRYLPKIAARTGLNPKSYRIKKYKARWGSCNNRGELSFNALLAGTSFDVINYVIIHELCHLVYLNHSQQFWQLVADCCPNYRQAQKDLKQFQAKLTPYSF